MGWRGRRARTEQLMALQVELATLALEGLRDQLGALRDQLARRDAEVAAALERMAETCRRVDERTEPDRAERLALVDALTRFSHALLAVGPEPLPQPAGPATSAVIGGTVDPGVAPAVLAGATPEPAAPPDRDRWARSRAGECSVRFRFGNQWIEGFEIAETVRDAVGTRYRLRRKMDGWVLPELFDEADVRPYRTLPPSAVLDLRD